MEAHGGCPGDGEGRTRSIHTIYIERPTTRFIEVFNTWKTFDTTSNTHIDCNALVHFVVVVVVVVVARAFSFFCAFFFRRYFLAVGENLASGDDDDDDIDDDGGDGGCNRSPISCRASWLLTKRRAPTSYPRP